MIATVTTHQSQLHCRILLTEETHYIINLATRHISSEQNITFIIHTILYNMTQMNIFINKVNKFTTNIKLSFLHALLQRFTTCNKKASRFRCIESLKTTFFGLYFCRKKYQCILKHFCVIRPESYQISWNYAAVKAITPLRSLKVTEFGTNRKLIIQLPISG